MALFCHYNYYPVWDLNVKNSPYVKMDLQRCNFLLTTTLTAPAI